MHALFIAVSLALRKAPGTDEIKGSYGRTKEGMSTYRKTMLLTTVFREHRHQRQAAAMPTSRHSCQTVEMRLIHETTA